jgi:hypothetical protein
MLIKSFFLFKVCNIFLLLVLVLHFRASQNKSKFSFICDRPIFENEYCKELPNKDCTMCRKERFTGAQTAGLTLRFREQQLNWIG